MTERDEVLDLQPINSKVIRNILATKKLESNLRAEEVRDRLDPEAIITQLYSLVGEADTIPIEELGRIQVKANILSGLLKKCMPDLRSLEVKGDQGKYSKLVIDMGEPEVPK